MSFIAPLSSSLKTHRAFVIFIVTLLLLQLIAWAMLPIAGLNNPYIDIIENIIWGKYFAFGYDKDPYLCAWVTYWVYLLSGKQIAAVYLFNQLSIGIALFAIWRLSRRFLTPLHSLIAVSLLIGNYYFTLGAAEFNDDVFEIMLWALTCLFFYDACVLQRKRDWLAMGLFAGLTLMDKYFGVMLLGAFFFFLLCNKTARQSWAKARIYWALIPFALLVMPNLLWLFQHHFIAIDYALNRGHVDTSTLSEWLLHLKNPSLFVLNMLGVIGPILALYFLAFWKSLPAALKRPRVSSLNAYQWQFLLFVGLGPFVLSVLFSLFSGAHYHYSWGTPLFSLIGIVIVAFFQPDCQRKECRVYGILCLLLSLLWITLFIIRNSVSPYFAGGGSYQHFPGKALAALVTTVWHQDHKDPLTYVMGNRKTSGNVALFSADEPYPLFDNSFEYSPWIDPDDLAKKGGIMIWQVNESTDLKALEYTAKQQFPTLVLLPALYELPWQVNDWVSRYYPLPAIPPVKIKLGILPKTPS